MIYGDIQQAIADVVYYLLKYCQRRKHQVLRQLFQDKASSTVAVWLLSVGCLVIFQITIVRRIYDI